MRTEAGLDSRLGTIADAVLPGQVLADLCCDHARLAIALIQAGKIPRAIAGDIAEAPLARTRMTLLELGLADRISLRQGDGFTVLEPGEAATVVIAGVGAPLASAMLERAHASGRLAGVRRLILQPNDVFPRLGQLRERLYTLGWGLIGERLVHAHHHFYVVLIAEPLPAGLAVLDEIDRELGPWLRRGDDPLLPTWLDHERARIEAALAAMARGRPDPTHVSRFQRWLDLLSAHSSSAPGPSARTSIT